MIELDGLHEADSLELEDQTLLRQGVLDRKITFSDAMIQSWGLLYGYTYKGNHATSVQFITLEDFTVYNGRTYFVKSGVALPYNSFSSDPSVDSNLYVKSQGGATSWGNIEGTLSNQTDLQNEFNSKVDKVSGETLTPNKFTDTDKVVVNISTKSYLNLTSLLANAGNTIKENDLLFTSDTGFSYQATVDVNSNVIANTSPILYAQERSIPQYEPSNGWDFEVVFNDGVELRSGFGNRNTHGNKAVDFSRASESGNVNKSDAVETVAVDEPCITKSGLSVYGSYINYFASPQSAVTQVCTIPAGDYTLWVLGSGSATVSYGAATKDNPLTFNSSGEALTVTIVGTVTLCNLIDLNKAAPPILTPSAPASRSSDIPSIPMMNNMPVAGKPFTIELDVDVTYSNTLGWFLFNVLSDADGMDILTNASSIIFRISDGSTLVQCAAIKPIGKHRINCSYDGFEMRISIDGFEKNTVELSENLVSYPLGNARLGSTSGGTEYANTEIKAVRLLQRALTSEQCASRGGYDE